MLNLKIRFGRIRNFVVDNCVNFARNIIFGNGVLIGDVSCFGADVQFDHAFNNWPNQTPTRVNRACVFTKTQFNTTLVLIDLPDGGQDEEQDD